MTAKVYVNVLSWYLSETILSPPLCLRYFFDKYSSRTQQKRIKMLGCNNDNLTTVSHQAQQPTTTLSSDKLPPPDSMFMTRIASITLNSHHCSETRLEREQNGLFRKELRKKYKDTSISGCKMIFYPHVVYRQGLPNKWGNKRSGREVRMVTEL